MVDLSNLSTWGQNRFQIGLNTSITHEPRTTKFWRAVIIGKRGEYHWDPGYQLRWWSLAFPKLLSPPAPTSTDQHPTVSTDIYRCLQTLITNPAMAVAYPEDLLNGWPGLLGHHTVCIYAWLAGICSCWRNGGTETKRDRYWNDWLTKSPVPRRLPVREPKNCNSKAIQRTWTSENVNQL